MHWLAPDSRSRALHERARSRLLDRHPERAAPSLSAGPWIAEARGAWLHDVDGRRYLDLAANEGSLLHGHGHPLINAAVADQLERGCCTSLPGEPELALAELLCGRVPSFERIHLCGSEDDALRLLRTLLRHITGRTGMLHVDADPAAGADAICAAIDAAGDELAAVVIDPAPACHGFAARDAIDLVAIETCARDRGALVVLDERRAFRFGFAGAQGRFGASPDLTLLGAQIGGGRPAAALAGLEQCMLPPEQPEPGVSYDRHDRHDRHDPHDVPGRPDPLGMVAGHAALTLLDLAAFEHLDAVGDAFRTRIAQVLDVGPLPLTVTGIGSAFSLRGPDEAIIDALLRVLLAEGVLLNPDGTGYLGTTCGPTEIEHCAGALRRAVAEVAADADADAEV